MALDLITAVQLGFSASVLVGGLALGLGSNPKQRLLIGFVLSGWLAIVVALGAAETLHVPPSASPAERGPGSAMFGLALAIPMAAIIALVYSVGWLRERLLTIPLSLLVALHSIRILGVVFLVWYVAGRLPAPFAPIAGWGDILVGLFAVPVAILAARRPDENRAAVFAWNVFGIADLVVAVSLGVAGGLSGTPGSPNMTLLPMLLIPGFLVPLLATVHLAIFYKLRRMGANASRTSVFA